MWNWTEYRLFYRQFRQRFHDTGAVLPSGRFLGQALARAVAEEPASGAVRGRRILEVGPGTGAVTQQIVPLLRPDDRLDLVEINEQFVAMLNRRFADEPAFAAVAAQVTVRQCGIEEVEEREGYDIIISSLPLNNFSAAFVRQVLNKYLALARPGAWVSFFEYMAVRDLRRVVARGAEKERLAQIGAAIRDFLGHGQARRTSIWRNVPPAWAHELKLGVAKQQGQAG